MAAAHRGESVAAWLLAALLLTTGTLHFVAPSPFESIVPSFLGSPGAWVYASGVAELACAVGLTVPRTRRRAAWLTVALFVVVFPANVTMAVRALEGHGNVAIAFARLPLQIPLVGWALYITGYRGRQSGARTSDRPR